MKFIHHSMCLYRSEETHVLISDFRVEGMVCKSGNDDSLP